MGPQDVQSSDQNHQGKLDDSDGKESCNKPTKRREKGFVCFLSDKHSGRKNITLLEEMIASQQFVNVKKSCSCWMLFYVVPKGKMFLVGCYILGLGPMWSSDFVFFGSELSHEDRTYDATSGIKLSVA